MAMDRTDKLFEDFPASSKADWLAKVEKDLKGRPLEDLHWHLGDQLDIDPFAHRSDSDGATESLSRATSGNDWEIGEYIPVHDVVAANKMALEGLNGGVQSLGFELFHPLEDGDLNRLLAGIELPLISVNFGERNPDKQPLVLLRQIVALVKERSLDNTVITGSVDFDPMLDWSEPPMNKLAEAVHLIHAELPRYKTVQVNGRYYHAGPQETSRELGYMLAKGNAYMAALDDLGVPPEVTNAHLQFSVAVSTSYFVEIAKIRALRILWLNVLKGYGLENNQLPEIVGHLASETQDEQMYTNMIRASTQAMSAVIGGVDRLYILPANSALKEAPTPFTRRIARNLQHLLKMESHMDKVVDPGAGSYYVEQLTQKIATQAWDVFRKLEARGAFSV